MKGTRFINELLKILSFKANGSFWAQKWCCAHSKFFLKKICTIKRTRRYMKDLWNNGLRVRVLDQGFKTTGWLQG